MGKKRTEHIERGSHGLDQVIGRLEALDGVGVNLDVHLFIDDLDDISVGSTCILCIKMAESCLLRSML